MTDLDEHLFVFCVVQVRQLQKVEETGEWRAYVLGLDPIGDVSGPLQVDATMVAHQALISESAAAQ